MMSKIVKTKTDGSLQPDFDSSLFNKIKKTQAWYMNRFICLLLMIGFMLSDIAGFYQIATETINEKPEIRLLIMVGFTAAFELAPLYIGYSISLKCYKLGQQIHTVILSLSLSAFVLGIVINGVYRFMTMQTTYISHDLLEAEQVSDVAFPLTVLLTVLPLITSLVNIVIGCLVFDPLYFDLIRIKRRINVLQEKKRQLEALVAELELDKELEESAKQDTDTKYKIAENELKTAKERLISYADLISITFAP